MIGIDLGGTKIEGVVLGRGGAEVARRRVATPAGDYDATVAAIATLVADLERDAGGSGGGTGTAAGAGAEGVGVGIPGTISPATGLVKNANSTCLNGRPLDRDLERALGRPVRLANDANCFALSEATDGVAAGAAVVFGVILGTGVGGGIVVHGRGLTGPHAIAGEWGHNPLPWPCDDERPGPACWCGRHGCLETFLSGPALARDGGDLDRYVDRLARGLATVINLLDPDVVVLGGGVSNIERLYTDVPPRLADRVFSDRVDTPVLPAAHGDASGVRGAARLWSQANAE